MIRTEEDLEEYLDDNEGFNRSSEEQMSGLALMMMTLKRVRAREGEDENTKRKVMKEEKHRGMMTSKGMQ